MQIGKRSAVHAERLSGIEAGIGPAHSVTRLSVTRSLFDPTLDRVSVRSPTRRKRRSESQPKTTSPSGLSVPCQ
jgi:hypothetical protein